MIKTLILDELAKESLLFTTVTHQVIEQFADLKQLLLCLPQLPEKAREGQ
jgi:hypothetical protein